MFDPDVVWPVFVATWIVLIVVAFFVFHVSRDAARKRRLFPRYIVGVGVLFVGFIWATGFPLGMVLVSIPVVAFFTWLKRKWWPFSPGPDGRARTRRRPLRPGRGRARQACP